MMHTICWIRNRNSNGRKVIAGWTLHSKPRDAIDFTLNDLSVDERKVVDCRTPYVYDIHVDESGISEEFFEGIMVDGYYFVEGEYVDWIKGSTDHNSKCSTGSL